MLLLLLVDVDAVVVVVVADLLSEKLGAVYPEAVAYGTQKLKFKSMLRHDSVRCLKLGVILKIYLGLRILMLR